MCAAVGDRDGRRPDWARLHVVGSGKWEPEVVRVKRMRKHWQAELPGYEVLGGYWDAFRGTAGKKGLYSMMRRTLEKAGLQCDGMGLG